MRGAKGTDLEDIPAATGATLWGVFSLHSCAQGQLIKTSGPSRVSCWCLAMSKDTSLRSEHGLWPRTSSNLLCEVGWAGLSSIHSVLLSVYWRGRVRRGENNPFPLIHPLSISDDPLLTKKNHQHNSKQRERAMSSSQAFICSLTLNRNHLP